MVQTAGEAGCAQGASETSFVPSVNLNGTIVGRKGSVQKLSFHAVLCQLAYPVGSSH